MHAWGGEALALQAAAIMSGANGPARLYGEEIVEAELLQVGHGKQSCKDAVEAAARAATRGGALHPLLEGLAACGRGADHEEERLWKFVDRKCDFARHMPKPYQFSCPLLQQDRVVEGVQYMLLPHEVFSHIAASAPMVFDQLFGNGPALEKFWEGMRAVCQPPGAAEDPATARRRGWHEDWLRSHPAAPMGAPGTCVPMGMHGDAGEYYNKQKIMILTWGSIAVPGPTIDTRILATAIKEAEMVPSSEGQPMGTLFTVFRVLQWSLAALCAGRHPTHDHMGLPWEAKRHPEQAANAGKALTPWGCNYRGAWCELRGDWEFLKTALALREDYLHERVCHLCAATKEPGRPCSMRRVQRSREFNSLRGTLRCSKDFVAAQCSVQQHHSPLLDIPGFDVWLCTFDCMHTLELGILQRAIPCALKELTGRCAVPHGILEVTRAAAPWGRGPGRPIDELDEDYRKWAKGAKMESRVRKFTDAWISGACPKISQAHAKAAALRGMLPWISQQCAAVACNSPYAALRAAFFREICALERVWLNAGRFMTSAEAEAAAHHGERAMVAYVALEEASNGRWRFMPKVHALSHLVFDAARLNPRWHHCYQDEDMVGRVKKIYTKCHAKSAALRVLQRYALAMCITIRGRQREARGLQLQGPAPEPMGSTAPAPRRPRRAKKAHAGGPRGRGEGGGEEWTACGMEHDMHGLARGSGEGRFGALLRIEGRAHFEGVEHAREGECGGGEWRGVGGRSTWPGRLATTGDCGGAEWTAMRGAGYGFRARGGMHAGQRSRGRPARHNARRAVCSPRSINDAFAERGSAFWGQIHAFSGLKPRRAGPAPGAGRGENLRRRRSPRSTK